MKPLAEIEIEKTALEALKDNGFRGKTARDGRRLVGWCAWAIHDVGNGPESVLVFDKTAVGVVRRLEGVLAMVGRQNGVFDLVPVAM